MLKYHRTMLSELSWICNQLGVALDYTSTNEAKLRDRQRALMDVSKVLFGVLADCKDNPNREEDLDTAYKCLEKLEALRIKTYPDRSGYLKPEERLNQKESMTTKTPDYERIIKGLTTQVEECKAKMEKNQNEPRRFYYHRRQWMIVESKLEKWTADYNAYLTTNQNNGQ